ncbi:hypothetical protein ACH4TE_11275 [Streptomyces sioyaensis]|uniref:hypothetical protein n=1 Tax=Streptomyces sioyaensis TaxID=67364 RepID=UPI00378DEC6A
MTDRRRRAALLLQLPSTAPGTVLLRERKPSSASPDPGAPDSTGSDRDNPFAPPPADAPDQEWRPRHPAGPEGQDGQDEDGAPSKDDAAPSWGSQWSPRQPGRQNGGFGTRPGGRGGPQGGGPQGGGPGGSGGGLRWDPTDPAQRRARYALLAGMWAFFCVLFSLPEVALLLAALALYWGVSALRAKPDSSKATAAATTAAMEGRPAPAAEPAPGGQPGATSSQGSNRPQVTAAIAGLVTASLALMMVAATFTVQIVYRDYFTCVNDALTQSSGKSCEKLLPKELRPLLSARE